MIVTVSRAYGAAANVIARRAASALGYRLVDEELDVVVATQLGAPRDVVESLGERPPPFGERVLAQLGGAVPELAQPAATFDDDLAAERRRAIERAVREVAERGDAIVLGRGASGILAGRPDLLRVFIHAPLVWRVAHIAQVHGLDAETARSEIVRIDEARRRYGRDNYRTAWGETGSYDLTIDTARFGLEGAAEVLVAAVRALEG